MWTKAGYAPGWVTISLQDPICGLSTLLKGTSGTLAGLLHFCPHWGLYRERSSSLPSPPTNDRLLVIGL